MFWQELLFDYKLQKSDTNTVMFSVHNCDFGHENKSCFMYLPLHRWFKDISLMLKITQVTMLLKYYLLFIV